jgi:hypothetical protein
MSTRAGASRVGGDREAVPMMVTARRSAPRRVRDSPIAEEAAGSESQQREGKWSLERPQSFALNGNQSIMS